MVKSFQGQQIQPDKQRKIATAADFMTKKLITFHPEQEMEEVIRTLIEKRISGAPVCDEDSKLVGVISEGDCLKELVKGKYNNMPNRTGKVKDYMTTAVRTLNADTPILEAARHFLEMKVRRFPIVENGKLIGLLSQSDVLKGADQLKSEDWNAF